MKKHPLHRASCYAISIFVLAAFSLVCCDRGKPSATQRAEAEMWMNKEYDYFQKALYDSCLVFLDKADSLAGNDDTVKAYTCAERAVIMGGKGQMAEGIPYAKKSAELSEKLQDYETLINMYSTIGVLYRRLGQTDSAIAYYKKGLSISKRVDAKDYVANLMNNIAVIFIQQDRMAEALSYCGQAEHWARMAKDTSELYNALGCKASLLVRQGKHKAAKDVIEPYFDDIIRAGNIPYMLKCASPLLTSYIELGMTDKAEEQMKRLKPLMDKLETASIGRMGIYEIEAKLYHKRKEYAKELAIWNLIDSLNRINQSTAPYELLYHKAECQNSLGNKDEALRLMRQAYEVGDSLKNSDIGRQMSEFSVRYNTQEKELELARVKQEKAKQQTRTYLVIIIMVIVCALFVVFAIYHIYRRHALRQAHELDMRRRHIEGIEEERARLARDLHDGTCNDLLGLSMMIGRGDSRSLDTVRQIRDNVRRISHELMPPSFAKIGLDGVLRDYFSHYPLDNCAVEYSSQEGRDWRSVPEGISYEVYRIAQEIMGNIVKHSHPAYIRAWLGMDGSQLCFTIDNDGAADNGLTVGSGIGSDTIAERVNSVNGTYMTEIHGGVYHLALSIPLHEGKK